MDAAISNAVLDAAFAYQAAGRCVFPVAPGTKWPSLPHPDGWRDLPWRRRYGTTPPVAAQVRQWFASAPCLGVSLACGAISGVWLAGITYGLEVLDVDDAATYDAYCDGAVLSGLDTLVQRCVCERTPGGGAHLGWLAPVEVLEGNLKLARRSGSNGPETLIETRGTGGQVVVAPTPPGVHPDHPKRGYVVERGDWTSPPCLTADEREALLTLARSFNTYVAPAEVVTGWYGGASSDNGTRPGDQLNQVADGAWWQGLLESHGWTLLRQRSQVAYWQRPGKDGDGCSATLGACGPYFYVFSTNATPFEHERAYSAFAAYSLLEHGGDFAAAAKALHSEQRGTYVVDAPVLDAAPPGWQATPVPAAKARLEIPGLLTKKSGEPLENVSNILLFLQYHPAWQGRCWWDAVRGRAMIDDLPLSDETLMAAALWFGTVVQMSVKSLTMLERCLIQHCRGQPRDLIQTWLNALPPWDRQPRLAQWLQRCTGAEDTVYTRMVGRMLLVQLVARAMAPGCICRYVIILEGAENIGKSALVKALAGEEWYAELSLELEGKESHMLLQGAWLAEFPELDAASRTAESRLKAFITQTRDTWIPKYSNNVISMPRRTVFVGTINPEGRYMKGQTGNTRFLPVGVTTMKLRLFEQVREQLYAEALALYHAAPETWWQMDDDEARAAGDEREERRVQSIYEDDLAVWLEQTRFDVWAREPTQPQPEAGKVTWRELATGFLRLESPERWKDQPLQHQMGTALRALGWRQTSGRDANGRKHRFWQGPVEHLEH